MDTGWSKIVKEDHIRFSVKQDNVIMTGIGFNMARKFHLLQQKKLVDIIFKTEENEWQGQKALQLKVIDFRLSG
jgi:single-stranded-DNA-specific exonuclease